jgi:hypothetical protein
MAPTAKTRATIAYIGKSPVTSTLNLYRHVGAKRQARLQISDVQNVTQFSHTYMVSPKSPYDDGGAGAGCR